MEEGTFLFSIWAGPQTTAEFCISSGTKGCVLTCSKCQVFSQLAKPYILKGFQEYYNSLLLFISQNISDSFLSQKKKRQRQLFFFFLTWYLTSEELQDKTDFLTPNVHQTTMTSLMRRDISAGNSLHAIPPVQGEAPFNSVLTSWNEDTRMCVLCRSRSLQH